MTAAFICDFARTTIGRSQRGRDDSDVLVVSSQRERDVQPAAVIRFAECVKSRLRVAVLFVFEINAMCARAWLGYVRNPAGCPIKPPPGCPLSSGNLVIPIE